VFEIGNSLREARARRGIEFAQAEQVTKIRVKYLRALEEERFDVLPSDTYVRGFLRTYADYLGLDGQLYLDEYTSRFATGENTTRARRSSPPPNRRNRRLETGLVLFVLAAITIVPVVLISAWSSSGHRATPPPPARSPATARAAKRAAAPGLEITAVHGSSYLAVHLRSASGPVIFEGTVAQGQTEPFAGGRFWFNVSAPENLVIRVRGAKIQIGGYRPRVVTVTPTSWHLG
jgi:cytoskeleton protein RodZ